MGREVSFDRPPAGFSRKGQEQGCLVLGRNPHSAPIAKLKEKLAAQEAQIAELKAMVEELASAKKGKKTSA